MTIYLNIHFPQIFKDQDVILNSPENYGENVISLRLHPQKGAGHSGKQNELS